jgi:hypothetical protein
LMACAASAICITTPKGKINSENQKKLKERYS